MSTPNINSPETKVPSLPTPQSPEKLMAALKELIEVREGIRGNELDANVTWRELVNSGIANITYNGQSTSGSGGLPFGPSANPEEVDLTPPPQPQNLAASGAIQSVILTWSGATSVVALSEVWRSTTNVAPNVNGSTAVLVGTTEAYMYADNVGLSNVPRYYWVRFRTKWDVAGPYSSGVAGSTGMVGGVDLTDAIITSQKIASGAISSYAAFGGSLRPVESGATLPALPNASYPAGALFLNTTDGKLYRNVSNVWTAAVPAADISGQLADAQVAALAASKVTGQLTNAQIADLAAAKLTGTISASQIADGSVSGTKFASGIEPITVVSSVPGSKSTSTIFNTTDGKLYRWNGSAYVATVPTADLSGTITDAQVAGLSAAKVTGQLSDSQIAAIAAAKLTGSITSTQITDNSITTAKIAANAVTASQIAANTITASQIASGTITSTQISAGTITASNIAAGTIVSSNIAAGTIAGDRIAANAITASQIATDTITAGQIAAGAISASELAVGAVTAGKIAANAVTATEIAAGSVTTAKIAASAVTAGEIAAGTITSANIAAGTITGANIAAGTIAAGNIVSGTITSSQIAANTITASNIAGTTITADKIASGTITASQIATGTLTADRMATGTIIAGSGVIANGAITNALIGNLAVDTANIANGAIVTAKIGDGQITNAKIDNVIQSTNYSAGTAGWKINKDGTAEFGAAVIRGTLAADQIAANSITSGKIAANSITSDKISVGTLSAISANMGYLSAGRIDMSGDEFGTGWGYFRTYGKWWQDGNSGYVFARNGTDGATLMEVKAGYSTFRMSSWSDNLLEWKDTSGNEKLYIDAGGNARFSGTLTANAINAVNTINIAGNAVTIASAGSGVSTDNSGSGVLLTMNGCVAGQPIILIASFGGAGFLSANQAAYNGDYRIVRNDNGASVAQLYTFPVFVGGGAIYNGVTMMAIVDDAPAGTNYFWARGSASTDAVSGVGSTTRIIGWQGKR